jgi:hypothetical protein
MCGSQRTSESTLLATHLKIQIYFRIFASRASNIFQKRHSFTHRLFLSIFQNSNAFSNTHHLCGQYFEMHLFLLIGFTASFYQIGASYRFCHNTRSVPYFTNDILLTQSVQFVGYSFVTTTPDELSSADNDIFK